MTTTATEFVVLDDYFVRYLTLRENGERAHFYSCVTCRSCVIERNGNERRKHYEYHKREGHKVYKLVQTP